MTVHCGEEHKAVAAPGGWGAGVSDWGEHTPGPWEAVSVEASDGERIPTVAIRHFIRHEKGANLAIVGTAANARLISKAYLIPRLEAALDEYWDAHVESCHVCTNPPRGVRGCPVWLRLEALLAELRAGIRDARRGEREGPDEPESGNEG